MLIARKVSGKHTESIYSDANCQGTHKWKHYCLIDAIVDTDDEFHSVGGQVSAPLPKAKRMVCANPKSVRRKREIFVISAKPRTYFTALLCMTLEVDTLTTIVKQPRFDQSRPVPQ